MNVEQHFCAGVVHVVVPHVILFGVAPVSAPDDVPPSLPPELLVDAPLDPPLEVVEPPLDVVEPDDPPDDVLPVAASSPGATTASSAVDPPHATSAAVRPLPREATTETKTKKRFTC